MALDTDKTKDTLFGGIKKAAMVKEQPPTIPTPPAAIICDIPTQRDNIDPTFEKDPRTLPKWQQLDKVTVLLSTEQKEGLDRVAKKLMKFRSNQLRGIEEKERITANTILRSLIDNFLELEDSLQLETLTSEKEVREWIANVFK